MWNRGLGRNSKNQIRKRAGPSMVEGHGSLFGAQNTDQIHNIFLEFKGAPRPLYCKRHQIHNIEGDASENFIPHMFESEVPTSIKGMQRACREIKIQKSCCER